MIKTFAALALADLRGDWSEPVVVAPEHRAHGDGILRHAVLPLALPLREVVTLALALSDNTAANTLVAAAGGLAAVNGRLEARGFGARLLRGLSAAGEAAESGIGVCTPREHARAVAALAEEVPPAYAALHAQQDRRSLARGLGYDARFAHKTGTVDDVRHDGGVLERGASRLAVTCFTAGGPHAEWVDHPACVAMGEAMVRTCRALGWDDVVVAG
jgi:beta-lactamase class A